MKIPDKITILSTIYEVVKVDRINEVDPDGKCSALGMILYDDCQIRLLEVNEGKSNREWQVLFHELIHALIKKLNIEQHINDENFEDFIDTLATGLFDTLNRNGLLTDGSGETKKDS